MAGEPARFSEINWSAVGPLGAGGGVVWAAVVAAAVIAMTIAMAVEKALCLIVFLAVAAVGK
jgi:hypothetical protein